jgi:hypothetical protein
VGKLGLGDELRLARVGHVERREIFRRAFMGEPEDAAAVAGDLHADAFADAAEPADVVMTQKLVVPRRRVRTRHDGTSVTRRDGLLFLW